MPVPRQRGIERVSADFLAYRPPLRFDLVLCLQVLEHLQDPETFARKLLDSGRIVIMSVPYQWPAGRNPRHLQDPVSEAKLIGWAGRGAGGDSSRA
jgi:2-polyprenyl-3-methyl-5-hydroxy-6-metoxy-1,4-benzoquinol methylase